MPSFPDDSDTPVRAPRRPEGPADQVTPAVTNPPQGSRNMRVLSFCHDSFGLGHFRRTTNLARAVVDADPGASVLCLTAAPRPEVFSLPPRVDFVRLPGVTKDAGGAYVARKLGVDTGRVVSMRKELIRTAAREFEPDVVVVDHAPLGVAGELIPMLEEQRLRSPSVRIVLGLRDILDEPKRARAELARPEIRFALEEWYDAVFVFGHPHVCDVAVEYGLSPKVRRKLRYVGVACAAPARPGHRSPSGPRFVVTVGGGEDGFAVLDAVADWLTRDPEAARDTTLVTGPLLADAAQARLRARLEDTGAAVMESTPDLPELIANADAALTMGGYNTVYEGLQMRRSLVVVPRVQPRREQWERATRLQRMGLLDVVEPRDLGPDQLRRAMGRASNRPALDAADVGIRFDGADIAAATLLSGAEA